MWTTWREITLDKAAHLAADAHVIGLSQGAAVLFQRPGRTERQPKLCLIEGKIEGLDFFADTVPADDIGRALESAPFRHLKVADHKTTDDMTTDHKTTDHRTIDQGPAVRSPVVSSQWSRGQQS